MASQGSERVIAQMQAALLREPGNAALLNELGNAYAGANRPEDAIATYTQVLALRPDFAEAHFNLGNVLNQQGRLAEAADSYRRAIAQAPGASRVHINLGVTLCQMGAQDEAVASLRRAAAINPRSFAAQFNLGIALAAAERLAEAIGAFNSALAIDPRAAGAQVNLGLALRRLDRLDESLAAFRAALAIAPDASTVHIEIGRTLEQQGNLAEAGAAYEKAIAIDQPLVAYINLGLVLQRGHRLDDAFTVYRRHAAQKYGGAAGPIPPSPTTPFKLKHDREQLDYLGEEEIEPDAVGRLRAADAADPQSFGPCYDAFFHLEGGDRLAGAAVNPALDTAEIERRWQESRPNLVIVDDLLTAQALAGLRRFCWGSTIWRLVYENGYLGAFPEAGFAPPLLAQIAEELRAKLPRIIRRHPLMQWWAFKYDSTLNGIGMHADFAAVNVNFWITPDEANLDLEGGGLVVWDKPAPLDWDFAKYNNDKAAQLAFLACSGAKSVNVPHRCNRAVIFDSDLFHETGKLTFKEGYRNRRINITLLYGWRHDDGGGDDRS
jgi:Tfp pilus assembly protein PilF